jgi:hypothetical protein
LKSYGDILQTIDVSGKWFNIIFFTGNERDENSKYGGLRDQYRLDGN